jgi:hypothetical protein
MLKRKKKKNFRRTKRRKLKENRIRRKRKKTQKNSPKKKQNKSINWKKKMVEFLFVCFFGLVIWVLFFSGVLRIKKVEVRGYDKEIIVKEVKKIKNEKILNKALKNNLILFPVKKLKENIKEQNMVVKDVSCRRRFPDTLIIDIVKREQLFLWKFGDNKYQLRDESGKFIKELSFDNDDLKNKCSELSEQGGLQCVVFIDENIDDLSDNNSIQLFSEKAREILEELKKTVYFDENNIFKTRTFISEEMIVQNLKYGQLKFNPNGDVNQQMDVLKLFLEQKIDMADLHKLEYVDLTLENKVIYKFRHNEILEDEIKKTRNEKDNSDKKSDE